MIILTKSVLVLMISFIISLVIGYFMVPLLKKFKINQQLNKYLEEQHKTKKTTPTMGGLIFLLATLLSLLIMLAINKINLTFNFINIVFIFIAYAIIGFVDDYLIIVKKNNKGLTSNQKFLMQLIIATIFFYLFMKADNEPLLWIHTIGFKLNIGWLYGIFILIVLTASSNAVNLTDGLDGLAGGLSLIAFITLGLISWNTGWLEGYEEIALFSFALAGSLLGFLVYNTHPARIFMGDTGSLCLGATMAAIAILTRHEILLLVIGIVFVIETISVILQVGFYKLTKKRLFKMAPIHHTFEKLGFKETSIVKAFWIIGLIASMISIIYGIII